MRTLRGSIRRRGRGPVRIYGYIYIYIYIYALCWTVSVEKKEAQCVGRLCRPAAERSPDVEPCLVVAEEDGGVGVKWQARAEGLELAH